MAICDEPVSAGCVQSQILNLLNELQAEFGLSYLLIATTWRVRHASAWRSCAKGGSSNRSDGRAFDNPQHPYTRTLLAAVPREAWGSAVQM